MQTKTILQKMKRRPPRVMIRGTQHTTWNIRDVDPYVRWLLTGYADLFGPRVGVLLADVAVKEMERRFQELGLDPQLGFEQSRKARRRNKSDLPASLVVQTGESA